MKKLLPLVCALGCLMPGWLSASSPYEVPHKSVSRSGEFVIYCDNLPMRLAVCSFCEETKGGIEDFLGPHGSRNGPVEDSHRNQPPEPRCHPARPAAVADPALQCRGRHAKIELDVVLRGQLADIHFQEQLVHAILIEMEYRNKPAWAEGVPCIDPPQWLVEGLSTYLKNRYAEVDTDIYKTLLKNGEMPALGAFLNQNPTDMNAASLKIYQAYSLSFVQLLVSLQDGQQSLGRYIQDLSVGQDTPSQDLIKHFPALGGSAENLEKWWMLSMARIAASDRYKGLSMEDTEQRLTALLKFKIPVGKNGETKEFAIEDYAQFVKNPQAQPVLASANTSLQVFATQANPLYRPVIAQYQLGIGELQNGKDKPVAEELKNVAKYREMILHRMDQIADYLNWFEATQMANRSNSFEDYMTAAKEISNNTPKRDDAISHYLDDLEIQMQ